MAKKRRYTVNQEDLTDQSTPTFESIRNSISRPTSGMVDSLIKGIGHDTNFGEAWKPTQIKTVNQPDYGETIGNIYESLTQPRYSKKDDTVTTGIGKKKKVQSLSDYHKEQAHLKNLENNPYSQQMDDGTWIYAKSDTDFTSKRNTYLENQRKNQDQILYNKNKRELVLAGYTDERATRILELRDKSMDELLKEKAKIDKQLDLYESDELELNESQLEIYNNQLEDIDNALLHVETQHKQTDPQAIDIHDIDPNNMDPDQLIIVHGQRMTYKDYLDKVKRTQDRLADLSGSKNNLSVAPPDNQHLSLEDRLDENRESLTEGEAYKKKHKNQNFIWDPNNKMWLYTGDNEDFSIPPTMGKYSDYFDEEGNRLEVEEVDNTEVDNTEVEEVDNTSLVSDERKKEIDALFAIKPKLWDSGNKVSQLARKNKIPIVGPDGLIESVADLSDPKYLELYKDFNTYIKDDGTEYKTDPHSLIEEAKVSKKNEEYGFSAGVSWVPHTSATPHNKGWERKLSLEELIYIINK